MDLRGKKADLLVRADECARILGHPKHEASRFTQLSPGDRGVAVALQEHLDEQLAKIRSELFAFTTREQAE
ncbi:hypothetical protein [Fimbriiglobus ruber]|uniref:Uncharacterized protein n=1 Tax=Fimbriiglobus ruber TaxID=1908690 RepID=A0A225DLW0_9BACT|nr:hypothetical protein [Fimbriiglobus ruber]OWK39528.1 hypothetical protein FRUB_06091 [Fimbriiglobus ruber]